VINKWLTESTPAKLNEARGASSNIVPATNVAGCAHADQSNRGQSSALSCRARHRSSCLSQRRPSVKRSDQRPHVSSPPPQCQRSQLSCPPTQWLAEPRPTRRTEAIAAPSPFVPANTVAELVHADQANRGQSSTLTCRARHLSGCLSPCRPSEQRPDKRPLLTCPSPQWLFGPTLTKRIEARTEPSPVVLATIVAA
jgi:hypothetical protein